MTDTSFLDTEFLVLRNREFSDGTIHPLFHLERKSECIYIKENWNNTRKDVNKVHLRSQNCLYIW